MKYIITPLLLLCTTFSYSQKIQIKDGQILKDKVPVAKMEGEAKLFTGTNILVKSLSDELLFTIHDRTVDYKSHFQPPTTFLEFNFVTTNLKVNRIDLVSNTSEKKIINYLFDEMGPNFLTKVGVDSGLINAFAQKSDESNKIAADTLKNRAMTSKFLEGIRGHTEVRNKQASIEFKDYPEGKLTWKVYIGKNGAYFDRSFLAIYQDDVMLGVLIKVLQKGTMYGQDYNAADYYIMKKIYPIELDGVSHELAPMALLNAQPLDQTMYVNLEGEKRIVLTERVDYRNAEVALVKSLIKIGSL